MNQKVQEQEVREEVRRRSIFCHTSRKEAPRVHSCAQRPALSLSRSLSLSLPLSVSVSVSVLSLSLSRYMVTP